MLSLEIQFLAGHYHATPWGHHPNEGVIEWPPSPWRILRMLLATWYWKAQKEIERPLLQELVQELASELPSFYLPQALGETHTRHYMPLFKYGESTKLFDTFLHFDRDKDTAWIVWPTLQLTPSLQGCLDLLLDRVGYLGRAESWVAIKRSSLDVSLEQLETTHLSVRPKRSSEEVLLSGRTKLIRVLSPQTAEEYDCWQQAEYEKAEASLLQAEQQKKKQQNKDPKKARLSKAKKDKLRASIPLDLFEALHIETGMLQKQGWSHPPASRWVNYVQEYKEASTKIHTPTQQGNDPTIAIFGLSGSLRPRLLDVLSFTEQVHRALTDLSSGQQEVLRGCDQLKQPLKAHQHTFLLPQVNRNGYVEQLILYAPMGFNHEARETIERLHKIHMQKERVRKYFSRWSTSNETFHLVLMGFGNKQDLGTLYKEDKQTIASFGKASVWRTLTPFVPTRHPKKKRNGSPKLDQAGLQIGSPEHDLRRLLKENYNIAPRKVECVQIGQTTLFDNHLRWSSQETTRRHGKGKRAGHRVYDVRMTFSEPVEGPLVIGYAAHFGLGLFVPEQS